MLVEAMLAEDEQLLATILDPELEEFTLLDQDNNGCLHDNNLRAFSELLTTTCSDNMTVSVLCCGGIETFPLISEVLVEIDSAGVEVRRVLDLTTPDQGQPLTFAGIHQ